MKKDVLEIVLTVISSRLHVLPSVLDSLVNQSIKPDAIHIYVSKEKYLLDGGIPVNSSVLKAVSEIPLVEIHWCLNIGPYRKLWPYLKHARERGLSPSTKIITVDDDTLYPPRFVEYMLRNHAKYQCRVAHRGRRIRLNCDGPGFLPYSEWPDGLHEPRLGNLPTGQSGIVYSLGDFPDQLEIEMATELAPTADDLWIHWLMARRSVPAVILQPSAAAFTKRLAFPTAEDSDKFAQESLWFAYNTHKPRVGQLSNDLQIQAIDAFFMNQGFSLVDLLRTEFEQQSDLY
jgi:hypothetical protein